MERQAPVTAGCPPLQNRRNRTVLFVDTAASFSRRALHSRVVPRSSLSLLPLSAIAVRVLPRRRSRARRSYALLRCRASRSSGGAPASTLAAIVDTGLYARMRLKSVLRFAESRIALRVVATGTADSGAPYSAIEFATFAYSRLGPSSGPRRFGRSLPSAAATPSSRGASKRKW